MPIFYSYWGVVHGASFLSIVWWVSSLYLQGKEKWQVWIVWQIWFVKPLPWVCATVALPNNTTQWNKYALAPVCISPRHFSHRYMHSWSMCKLLSVKKAQGKPMLKNWRRIKFRGGGGGALVRKRYCWRAQNSWAVIKALVSSIGWKKCVRVWKVWIPWMREQETQGGLSRREADWQQMNHNSIILCWLIQNIYVMWHIQYIPI